MSLLNEKAQEEPRRGGKYLIGVTVAFAVLALPRSEFRDIFRMAVWTAILWGVLIPYVWPFLIDLIARLALGAMCVLHLALMWFSYSHLPDDDYIVIGMIVIFEILMFSIPIAWLQVRSRSISRGLSNEEESGQS